MVLAGAAAAWGQTAALPATADTYLKSGTPNRNQGSDDILRIQSSGANRALVGFEPTSITVAVASGSLVAARLELFIASNPGNWGSDGGTVDAHRLIAGWTQTGATWNCAEDANPANGSPDCASQWSGGAFEEEPSDTVLHTGDLEGWIAFDVTADVAAFLAGGAHHGWLIKKTEEGQSGRVDYASKEAGSATAPRLVLVVESAEHDETPPRLAITSPADPVLVNEPAPEIGIEYSDGGSGVDAASLAVLLDGVDVTVTCTAGAAAATCSPGPIAPGSHDLEVSLADHAGNLATASLEFELLSGPGLHIVRLPIVADTYLRQGTPNQNQGGETLLRVRQSGKNRSLLRLDPADVASLLAGTTVRSARLELYIAGNGDNWGTAGRTIDLHTVTAPWSELGATWNCADDADPTNQQPDCGPQWSGGSFEAEPVASLLVTNGRAGSVGFDVTAEVSALAHGAVHEGWLIKKSTEGQSGRIEFVSRAGAVEEQPGVDVVFEIASSGDTEPPQLTFTAPGPVVIGDPMPTVELTFSDAGSGVDVGSLSVALDGTDLTAACTVIGGAASCPTPELSAGRHAANARIADLAGNPASATLTFDIVLDLGPPRVTIDFPADGSVLATPLVTLEGTVTTTRPLASLTVDGQPAVIDGSNFAAQVALNEGEGILRVIATDDLDRTGSAMISITLDTTAPELTLSSPADGQFVNSSSVRVTGEVGDACGLSSVRVNGEEAAVTHGRFEASVPLAEGANLLTAVAVDLAGNSAEAAREVTRFTLPEVTIDSPDDLAFIAATTVTVAGTVSDDVLSVTVNGVAASLSGTAFQAEGVPLIEGGNTVTATATGALGRAATATIHLVRDLTPPRLTVYRPIAGAVVQESTVAVSGLVNDIVPGTVNASEAVVTVNGLPAQVSNRSFFVAEVPLVPGDNTLVAGAEDASGNTAEVQVTVRFEPPAGPRLRVVTGDHQTAEIGTALADPLVVELLDAAGQPVADRPVVFALRGNNGALEDGRRRVIAVTDASGRAGVHFTLGTRAGVANQVVEASAPGFAGRGIFTATALRAAPEAIVVDSGGLQVGVAGRGVPRPLIAAVIDRGHNRLGGVPVRFDVEGGAGHFADGSREIVVATDSDGRAIVTFTLDPEEGIANNVVVASLDVLEEGPVATFVASGRGAGPPEETSISGLVLDNTNRPIAGATLRVKGTILTAETDAEGQFRIDAAPVGAVKLIVDGSTVDRPGSWPDLEFDLVTVPGRDNTVNMPIFLLPLDLSNGLFVDETRGGTLTLPDFPGFALEIAPGSVTFPGGGRSGQVSVTVVHNDKVPMVPNFGQQPRMIVTIQPAGARFEPPARLSLPNVEGLAPGEVTEMYSFDHDLGHFVSIGPATVSDDSTTIVADPGVGIVKAGWHCGGNPASSGTPHRCAPCQVCNGSQCVPGCALPGIAAGTDPLAPRAVSAAACGCSDGDPCTVNDRCEGGGCVGDEKKIVSVIIVAPAAAKAAQGIGFAALVEDENCPQGERSHFWEFGDGAISTAPAPSHAYAFPGEYSVTLKVSCSGCAGTTKTDRTTIKVIDVLVLSADVVDDEIAILLAPDGVTGDLTIELADPDSHTIVAPAPRAGGSYTESFNIPGLAEGEYQTVRATWEVEGVSVSDEHGHQFQVLGNWRHSQYNTPEDTMCGGTPIGSYITTNDAAGNSQCFNGPPFTFFDVMLPQEFIDQANLNGSGRVDGFGDVQADEFCPGTAAAPADADGHTFRQQPIVPSCGTALAADTLAGCLAAPEVACGDRIFIHTVGIKTVTDNCPACCGHGQFDNYTLNGACAGIVDLGNFMTIKLF